MSQAAAPQPVGVKPAPALNLFERLLTVWVGLCIVAGIVLGRFFPEPFHLAGAATIAQVNLPIAALVWLMIVPMLLRVDPHALSRVTRHWRGMAATLGVNWLVKPFSMAALGWLFIGILFRDWLPAAQIDQYIAGLILLAAAPCTAMVFVWSNLVDGDPHFTLTQVALNDAIMIVAFAPLVGLLLGLSAIVVPWNTLLLSVVLYIVVPVMLAQLWRRRLVARGGEAALARTLKSLGPVSISALLATLVLLFGLQGEQILAQPLIIALLAVPIVIQVYFNAGVGLLAGPPPRRCLVRGRALGPDRRLQFLRARRGHGHRPVWLPIGGGAGHGGGSSGRSAGHAVGRGGRPAQPALVRARLPRRVTRHLLPQCSMGWASPNTLL